MKRTQTKKNDPYHDQKPVHYANLISPGGKVSALCFDRPRAIDLKKASWTIMKEAVTCSKCLTRLAKTTGQ